MNEIHVVCQVCHELPKHPRIIYFQCQRGHLICYECYHDVAFINKKCGICRDPMEYPARNRTAENEIKKMLVTCEFAECDATMKYCEMKHHLDNECPAMEIECKYKRLGCNWKGPRRNAINHVHAGIDYDVLMAKIKETDEEISILKICDKVAKDWQNVIINNNVSATFKLNSIWQDFRMGNDITSQYVHRYCGNHERNIRMKLTFKIHVNDPIMHPIEIHCKLSVEYFDILNSEVSSVQTILIYAEEDNDDIWVEEESTMIDGTFDYSEKWESEWIDLIKFDCYTLGQVNKSMMKFRNSGLVKVFAYLL